MYQYLRGFRYSDIAQPIQEDIPDFVPHGDDGIQDHDNTFHGRDNTPAPENTFETCDDGTQGHANEDRDEGHNVANQDDEGNVDGPDGDIHQLDHSMYPIYATRQA